jgi:hypothetical protein
MLLQPPENGAAIDRYDRRPRDGLTPSHP